MSEKVSPQVGISTRNQPKYAPGEKILCFHGALIYEAKCLQVEKTRTNEYSYLVHYNGWSKNWDEWVSSKRILKYNEENLNKQKDLIASQKKNSAKPTPPSSSTSSSSSSASSVSGSTSEANTSQPQQPTTNKEAAVKTEPTIVANPPTNQPTTQLPSKEAVNGRLFRSSRKISNESVTPKSEPVDNTPEPPKKQLCVIDLSTMYELELDSEASNIKIPDGLQDWLHNDSDFILEQNKIIQLPSNKPISTILKDYQIYKTNEKSTNEEDIKQLPYLNETMNNIIKYFNTMLGSQLLYKFERLQYKKIIESKKQVSDVYGAIHFLRLMEKLNQVLSCDIEYEKESFQTLVYFSNDLLRFIDKNSSTLFNEKDYINPPPFYVRASI